MAPFFIIICLCRIKGMWDTFSYDLRLAYHERKYPDPDDPIVMPKLNEISMKQFTAQTYGPTQIVLVVWSLSWVCNTADIEGVHNNINLAVLRTSDAVEAASLLTIFVLYTYNWTRVVTNSLGITASRQHYLVCLARKADIVRVLLAVVWGVTVILPTVELAA